jgi:hypothetical protein
MNNYAVCFLSCNSTRCFVQLLILGNRVDPTHTRAFMRPLIHTNVYVLIFNSVVGVIFDVL